MKLSSKFIYFFGALGGLLFGYDTGIISGALHFLSTDLNVVENSLEEGFITASVLVGAVIGAVTAGKIADILGRKKSLLITSIIFCIGALLSSAAFSPEVIIMARIILGLAVGSASALVPMYLSELAPAEKRGSLAYLNQLMIIVGIFLSYIVNFLFIQFGTNEWNIIWGWRIALGLAAIPAFLMFCGVIFLPESPRFLMRSGKPDLAREVLMRIRGNVEVVNAEFAEINQTIHVKLGGIKDVFSKFVRPALIMGAGLAFLQQFTGCNTVLYYAPKILETAGLGDYGQRLVTVGIGAFNVLATLTAIAVVDRINRRTLFAWGAVVMGVACLVLAYVDISNIVARSPFTAQVIASLILMLYIIAFGITWGGTTWVVIGEIFPLYCRGAAVGIASMVNWISNFLVSLLFPAILGHPADPAAGLSASGLSGHPFWIFIGLAVFCVIAIIFSRTVLIETRGRSLEAIEKQFAEIAAR
jgi:sugar porter (SP) family MFS transporter